MSAIPRSREAMRLDYLIAAAKKRVLSINEKQELLTLIHAVRSQKPDA